jgi:hypothetical protein
MKYLLSFLAVVVLLLGAAYGLLFTQPGNDFLKPIIEKKVAEQVPLPTKLETFTLRPDRFAIALLIGKDTKIVAQGTMNLSTRSIDATYDVDIVELANLQKLIGQKLRGPFKTHGTVRGDQKKIAIEGEASVAGSATGYKLALRDFKPENLEATVQHLHLEKLLYMVGQPVFARALIDVDAKIPSLVMNDLDGQIATKITKGYLYPHPIQEEFNLSIPENTTFHGDIQTRLAKSRAINKVDFFTSLATLKAKALTYDIANASLQTDYRLHVPNLDKLYFVTNQHMKGKITVTGDVKTGKKGLQATAHSDTLGGAIDAAIANNKVDVKIKRIQTVALTDMLLYPHIFDSTANMTLDYDTVSKRGELHAELLNGQILPNKMSFMLRQMANFDITREVYERTTLDTKIDDKVLHSNFHMKSKLTELDTKNALVDLNKQVVDATIHVKIPKAYLPVIIKGKLTDPKIKIDAKDLMKAKAKEELEKRLPDNIKKSPAGDILKNFF